MAFINQAGKAKIAAALKAAMPKDVKYTLAIRDNMTVVMTIKSAPFDLMAMINAKNKAQAEFRGDAFYEVKGNCQLNQYYLDKSFDGKALEILEAAKKALYSADYYDDSDIQSDYFSCAYYVQMNVGTYDKPFVCTATAA